MNKKMIHTIIIVMFVAGLIFLPLPQFYQDTEESRHSKVNIKRLSLLLLDYESLHGMLPDDYRDKNGVAIGSWRVRLAKNYSLDERLSDYYEAHSWDSTANTRFINCNISLFQNNLASSNTSIVMINNDLKPPDELSTSKDYVYLAELPEDSEIWTKPGIITASEYISLLQSSDSYSHYTYSPIGLTRNHPFVFVCTGNNIIHKLYIPDDIEKLRNSFKLGWKE